MSQPLLGLVLSLLATAALAAPDPPCGEYETLRAQRDKALQAKNLQQYCGALSGLIRLMPATPPAPARLHCEAKATGMKVETWLGIRPDVVADMKSTWNEQCR